MIVNDNETEKQTIKKYIYTMFDMWQQKAARMKLVTQHL